MNKRLIVLRRAQVLYDTKWKTFLRRAWLFRHIPFVEFAFGAGSMAVGGVYKDSDFDVIVGARRGRIWSARFFAVIAFGIFGWRRKKLTHNEAAADKICLNHFVTERSFAFSPPRSASWRTLYANLVPLFGAPETIQAFWDANADWMGERRIYVDDLRHRHRTPSRAKLIFERMLSGRVGKIAECVLKKVQVAFIRRNLRSPEIGYAPRIVYTDDELEFHPDTRRNYRRTHTPEGI